MKFRVHAASFLQVNPEQAEQLYAYALDQAKLDGSQRVFDAYCGVGTLALLAAKQAATVEGVECVSVAVEQARYNATANGIQNAEFKVGRVE